SGDGFKLPDEVEARVEALVLSGKIDAIRPRAREVGKAYRIGDALGRYIEFAKRTIPKGITFKGMRVVVDCAHGAAYKASPTLLRELGAEVVPLNVAPDGFNINAGCGSLHPQGMQAAVREHRADVGCAHDGDADRVILADETGALVDGDQILAMCALDLKRRGALRGDTVIATVMSNVGLEKALRAQGIRLIRTAVGDRYVLEEMLRGNYNLGGEQSGHVIFLDHNTTGDGLITALQVLFLVQQHGKPLSALRQCMTVHPQVLVNVPVARRADLTSLPNVQRALAEAEAVLDGNGRLLVRTSGTEPVVRVMVEGEDRARIEALARSLAAVIEKELGA
ncbi:MAG: phosphoglucosamine mutase, partial [candidate division NC10 bacterium]|nr:phosphoglucosamine mutase [candidate division NC10 bacterium]